MRLRTPGPAIGLVLVLGGAAAGCGSDEMFRPELGTNERLIDSEAVARLARSDEGVEDAVIVGDIDGDGIDDAVIRSAWDITNAAGNVGLGSAVYVVYGGSGITGEIDLTALPTLVGLGAFGADVVAVGDVDGDGLADFLVGIAFTPGCGHPDVMGLGERPENGGAFLVYGSTTRLAGTHPIGDVGAFLRDPVRCTEAGLVAALGDIDGDGKADFALGRTTMVAGDPAQLFVFYGRGARWSGTVDLTTTADAVVSRPVPFADPARGARVGDVDGDGFDDFLIDAATAVDATGVTMDVRLVRGAATRLSGAIAFDDAGATQFGVHNCAGRPEIEALGDLDGDGADDFALSACRVEQRVLAAVDYHLFYGRRGGFPAQVGADDQDATLPTTHTGPSQLIGGDADGDGVPDLILADVGLHGFEGGVHLMKGRRGVRLSGTVDPIVRSVVTYVGQPEREPDVCQSSSCVVREAVGWGGLAVGDLNGDHHPDLVIGAPTNGLSLPVKGGEFNTTTARVYVVSPPASANP